MRDLQRAVGFGIHTMAFQDEGTLLSKNQARKNETTAEEYIRMIALSRIMIMYTQALTTIQASWLYRR